MVEALSDANATTRRVLIVDDHRLVAETVASFLEKNGEYAVTLTSSLSDTLHALKKDGPFDLVLLDLKLPKFVSIKSVEDVVAAAGEAKVVLFSAHADRQTLRRSIDIGVRGLIPKTLPIQSLVSVLRLVDSGQVFFPVELSNEKGPNSSSSDLSDVELFVLRSAASGLTNKEIAADLDVSEASVKMHMRTICKKLDAQNRAHAVSIGRDKSIISG